jgi:hypothetical protein
MAGEQSVRYWFVEERDTTRPKARNLPTMAFRERSCPTCNHAPFSEVLCKGEEGLDRFLYAGDYFSWARAQPGVGHRFSRFGHAEAAIAVHRARQPVRKGL